jgi:hypothetical protein
MAASPLPPALSVAGGATLRGHGRVSALSGAGLIDLDGPNILTATRIDPSGGLDFTFSLTQPGAPTFANASTSGNNLLHLTDAAPFTLALTAANTITLDFTGAALVEGQTYLGGFFFDDTGSDPLLASKLSNATFVYTGLFGIVEYDGLVSVPSADFSTGTITDAKVMEFKVIAVPEHWQCEPRSPRQLRSFIPVAEENCGEFSLAHRGFQANGSNEFSRRTLSRK